MAYSMIAIAGLSWVVWGHHMFQSGMNPALGMAFMTTTMVIAVPSAIKTFNWLGTLWGGNIKVDPPMLYALAVVVKDLHLLAPGGGRQHQVRPADALRAGLRVDVRHRRPERHLHGGDAGRYLHTRHLLHRRATLTI